MKIALINENSQAAKKALYTGPIGDGKIFVYNVTRVVKIRTGEEDFAALQDVEMCIRDRRCTFMWILPFFRATMG